MKVSVLFFAASRDLTGKAREELEIPEGETVAGLLKRLESQYPALEGMHVRVAVNTEFAESGDRLHDKDEIAVLPPVSGG